ncbi:MAG: YfhO family protein [Lachnospiraceae bacterium]|nr:YfhO family protein [Lachnospiraceae bacterium]
MKQKFSSSHKYLLYSVVFWAYATIHLYVMYQNNRIAFNCTDGQMQFFPAMQYIRQLVINFLTSLIQNKEYSFPLIEWTLAMGEDTIATLNYYGLGHPLYLFSAFISEDSLPYFFNFLLYFQIYLGGITFIAFAYSHEPGQSPYAYVIGALLYSFSGFTYQCYLYFNFAHAMILIPLMFLGTYRSIIGKKKGVLGASVFLFALCGFFYLYVGSISIAVYTIYILIQNKTTFKNAMHTIKELVLEYAAGLGLSAFIFVPAVIGYLHCNRIPNINITFFVPFSEVRNFLLNLLFPPYNNLAQVTSISTIGVLMLLWLLFAKGMRNEKRNLIFIFLLCLFPPASIIMSGGANYNRWQIVFIVYIAYLSVKSWDMIPNLMPLPKICSIFLLLLLGLYGKKMSILDHERFRITISNCIIIVGLIVVVLPFFCKLKKEKLGMIILFTALTTTIIRGWRVMSSDMAFPEICERNTVSELSCDLEEDFCRIDYQRTAQMPFTAMNAGFSQGYYGVSGYFSILNASYTDALKAWNVNEINDYHTYGLRNRIILESLCAVKYLILDNTESCPPYGCVPIRETTDHAWILYENQNVLPLVYTYQNVFDEGIYSNMTGFEKQQVMLQAAAIEDYQGSLKTSVDYDNQLKSIPYTIVGLDKAVLSGPNIAIQNGGSIKLSAQLQNGCENYLITKSENCKFHISFEDEPSSHTVIITQYDNGKTGADLGQASWKEQEEITLSFTEETVLNIQDLELCCYDFTGYSDYIMERKNGIINTQVSTNAISSEIDINEDRIVCVAVPYSKGWHAEIDGKPAKIYKMNDMFMGVEIGQGKHLLVFKYCTEGLKCGVSISLMTLIIISFCILKKKHII